METRNCADCPAVLEEHKGAGRPRIRCQLCSAKRARVLRAERKRRQKEEPAEVPSVFSPNPSPNEPGYSAYSPTWRSPFANIEPPSRDEYNQGVIGHVSDSDEDDEPSQTFVDFD